METTLDVVEGMQFDRGYISPYFVTDPARMEMVIEDPYILLHEKKISSLKDLLPLLEQVAKLGRSLLAHNFPKGTAQPPLNNLTYVVCPPLLGDTNAVRGGTVGECSGFSLRPVSLR